MRLYISVHKVKGCFSSECFQRPYSMECGIGYPVTLMEDKIKEVGGREK